VADKPSEQKLTKVCVNLRKIKVFSVRGTASDWSPAHSCSCKCGAMLAFPPCRAGRCEFSINSAYVGHRSNHLTRSYAVMRSCDGSAVETFLKTTSSLIFS
jgi:hypothetical protein